MTEHPGWALLAWAIVLGSIGAMLWMLTTGRLAWG
jgi:hypothetical protein